MILLAGNPVSFEPEGVAKKARADGVPVALEIWPGMVHVFQIRGLPESREAIRRIATFIHTQQTAK